MTTAAIRQRLITYLADAEDNKVKAVYTLLEKDIEETTAFSLTPEQYDILEKEKELHIKGETPSYKRAETIAIIKGQQTL